ncbi:MAG: hypothetical protein ACI9JR_003056, partial [Gammaproteobacteria bacterium]
MNNTILFSGVALVCLLSMYVASLIIFRVRDSIVDGRFHKLEVELLKEQLRLALITGGKAAKSGN